MKTIMTVILLTLALVLPLCPAGAQEDEASGQTAVTADNAADGSAASAGTTGTEAAGETAGTGTAAPSQPRASRPAPQGGTGVVAALINKIIALLAPIGALFGQVTGIRIGGTTGTGIAALAGAKLLEDKVPPWIKWLLYLTGGTMFAGGGANVAQIIMQYLSM